MITVSTWDCLTGVRVQVEGHAEAKTKEERAQVCAGVSALMGTLLNACGQNAVWGGDGSGLMGCDVAMAQLAYLRFVLYGIELIARGYPGNVRFCRKDSLQKEPFDGTTAAAGNN